MTYFSIVNLPSDESILSDNIHKLEFIKGVSIYYDKTKTNRDRFNIYSNFNAWLEVYSKDHSIPFYKLQDLIKSLVDEVQINLLDDFKPNNKLAIPFDFMKKLNAIKKVGKAGDPYSYHTLLFSVFYYLPIANNYSIVCNDGRFLMSRNSSRTTWFYNNIQITKQGLFKCEKLNYGYDRCFPGSIITSNQIIYWDYKANYMMGREFEICLKILANCTDDHQILLSKRKDYNFNVDDPIYFEQKKRYEGNEKVEWEKPLPNGLTFYYVEEHIRFKIYAEPHVRDQYGNSIDIDSFYLSLRMLVNGKDYIEALINDSVKRQVEKLI